MRARPRGAAVYGIDIGKTLFHVAGADTAANVIQQIRMGRTTLLEFFANAGPAFIGMEACPGAQWLARKLQAAGQALARELSRDASRQSGLMPAVLVAPLAS